MNSYRVEQRSSTVLAVRFDEISAGWEQWVMLSADRHHDSIKCNRKLEKRHLEKAKQRGALIFDHGDLFCAMQGKFDPRKSYDEIRPEDVGEDYLDRIVKHAAEDYGPYAENFALITRGNHESNILKRMSTDLISNLVHRLNSDHGGKCHAGEYGGWVQFYFIVHKTGRRRYNMKYFHGAGGGGPVTKGVIQTNRQGVYLPDAHIVVNGHTHDSWVLPIKRERISQRGKQTHDLQWFIRTPGYKDDYGDGGSGWAVETWKPPKPNGCVWLRFWLMDGDSQIGMEAIQEVV